MDFAYEFLEKPWSRGSSLISVAIAYILILLATVKYLRNQALKED